MDLLKKIREGSRLDFKEQVMLTVRLSLPAILAQLSSILMQYIDASMVGRLGTESSAAVGLMASSLWLFTGIGSMATMGYSVQVAHRIGANDPEGARSVVRQSLVAMSVFFLLITVVAVGISPWLPVWLGGGSNITADASAYFAVFAAGLPLLGMNFLAGGLIRCAGDMKTPSLLNIMMCLLDVVFNFFLIFPTSDYSIFGFNVTLPGAGWGVFGAALGTVFAEAVTMALMMRYLLLKQPFLRLKGHPKGSFRPTKSVTVKAVKIATPLTVEHAVFCSAQIMITMIVAPLGDIAIAANAFAVTAESLCYMPGFGIGDAATAIVGQSFGAGRIDLVKRFCHISVGLGVVVMSVMGLLLWLGAPVMMEILSPVKAIQDLGTEMLRIEAWVEPMYAASIVAYGAFVGVGDTLLPAIMNFGSIWCVRVPLAAFMAPKFSLRGVWLAMAAELSFRGIIFLWRMWSNKWIPKNHRNPGIALENQPID